jgi:eukaryotic-like serine/threonine-protein kinase
MTAQSPAALKRLLITHFDLSELRALCFDLGVDHENLPANTKEELAHQLLLYLARRERIAALLALCQRQRPMVDWPVLSPEEVAAFIAPAQGRTAAGDRKRSQQLVLLDKVRRFWIEGVLAHSLAAREPLELAWQPVAEAVDQPWQGIAPPAGAAPAEATWLDLFLDSGRALLILGAPGSGKTISLLRLAKALLSAAEGDDGEPVPVVLNLASWAADQAQIDRWVLDELAAKYQIPRHLSRDWLAEDGLTLLLDGLDEVPDAQRDECIAALNQFRETSGLTGLVVCCRDLAYWASGRKLRLGQAIHLQPLSESQIQNYLMAAERPLLELRQALSQDEELLDMAHSPLLLSIMMQTYEDGEPLSSGLSESAVRRRQAHIESLNQQLFHDFCGRAFERRGLAPEAARKVEAGLAWLAGRLDSHNQTVFLVELMQPSWLGPRPWQWLYLVVSRLAMGLAIGPAMALYSFDTVMIPLNLGLGLLLGLGQGLLFERRRGLAAAGERRRVPETVVLGLAMAALSALPLIGLADYEWERASLWGLITGTLYALAGFFVFGHRFEDDIRIVEGLSWSWPSALKALPAGLLVGVVLGWLAGQALDFNRQLQINVALESGLVYFLFGGLRYRRLATDSYPNQGIGRALTNGLKAGLLFGLAIGLVVGLANWNIINRPFAYRPQQALFALLIYGGFFVFEHALIRLILVLRGRISFRYVRFLDLAASLAFLHKVGGGYIFMHRLLREHFVRLPDEP